MIQVHPQAPIIATLKSTPRVSGEEHGKKQSVNVTLETGTDPRGIERALIHCIVFRDSAGRAFSMIQTLRPGDVVQVAGTLRLAKVGGSFLEAFGMTVTEILGVDRDGRRVRLH